MRLKLCVLGGLFLALGACSPTTKYNWGNYSSALYDYQRDPNEQADYLAALAAIIEKGGQQKVPPGIIAEYGYMELSRGNVEQAISLFEKEKAAWPESAVFMDRAIATAKGGPAKPQAEPKPVQVKGTPTS